MLFDDTALKLVEISLALEMLRAIKMFLTITLKNVSSKCLNQPNTNIFVIVEKKPKNSPIAFASLSTAQEEHPS